MSLPVSARTRLAAGEDLAEVVAIHKPLKRWLGHLPDRAFGEAVDDGRLTVAERDRILVGYLMYRERQSDADIVIVHLAVALGVQRQGVGTELLDFLVRAVPDRRRIVVRCRRDFPAHGFWSRVGFAPVSEGAGRSADGKPLTTFERRLRVDPTLFDALFEPSRPFAVDLDVLLDLVTTRRQGVITRQVFVQLDQFDTHPLKTTSLLNELDKQPDAGLRHKARALMQGWASGRTDASPLCVNLWWGRWCG
jgi:GNAT superfamily N-acetyltransferase